MTTKKGSSRPPEQEAVRTTIVGARPPGSGKGLGPIPRGIEILVKKASVDPDFRMLLMERRAQAAKEIELELTPAEDAMLGSVPAQQLEAIIARTKVSRRSKSAFLGRVAAVMLAALGVGTMGCGGGGGGQTEGIRPDRPENSVPEPTGIRPDRPEEVESEDVESEEAEPEEAASEEDVQPSHETTPPPNEPATRGIRPDRPVSRPPTPE